MSRNTSIAAMPLSALRSLRGLVLAALALAGLLLATGASAQTTCTVTVTVTDDAGSPQSFVDVRLEGSDGNPYTNADITDENGQFRFVAVPAGKYHVSATTEGLASDSYAIELAPGAVQDVKVVLKRYSAQEQVVEVNAQIAELVDVIDVTTKSEISGEFISKTPLQNRRIEDIVAMMPGVIRTGSSDSTDISIGGGTSAQIAYRIDGLSGNDVVDGGIALQIPTAAIQSFKLITSGASAKYGEQSTGVAEIVTKSGGNENDFSYEMQFRDTDWGAQGLPGLDDAAKAVDDLINVRESQLLGPQVRAGFRLLGVDPMSTTEDDSNPPSRRRIRHTVSAGGPIKRDEAFFHATLESVQDDYGSPYVEGTAQNDGLLFTSKVNWNVWQDTSGGQASNRLEFTANMDVSDDAGYIGLTAPRSVNNLSTAGAWTMGVTDTHVSKDLAVLATTLSVRHQYATSRPEDVRAGVGTVYQIPLPPGGPVSYYVGQSTSDYDQTVDTIRGEVNWSKAVGARQQHTIDLGFNGDQTFFQLYQNIGATVSDLRVVDDTNALGSVQSLVGREITYGPPVRTDDEAWFGALYASDSWRISDRFTLQLGLRAEYQSFVGKIFLAPRIGFSLDPIGDGKTRFFGNWGVYYDRLFANFLQFTQYPDRQWRQVQFAPQFAERNFAQTSIDEIYKEAQATAINSRAADAVAWLAPEVIDRFVGASNLTAPTNKDWTLGISRQFPGNVRLEVAYRANTRTHQITNDTVTRSVPEYRDYVRRDIVYGTTGEGAFQQWSAEVTRPFANLWTMQLSYVQSHNSGPIGPPQNPLDPSDVYFVNGTLGNDRTHVAKLQGTTKIGKGKAAVDASVDFTWQTGTPVTASITRSSGRRVEPIGRNSLRLPSTRQLNFGIQKSFQLNTKEGGGFLPTIGFRAQIFNVLNQLNVTSALVQFETPEGTSTPDSFPPLRPDLVTTGVDVSRSLELGFSVSF